MQNNNNSITILITPHKHISSTDLNTKKTQYQNTHQLKDQNNVMQKSSNSITPISTSKQHTTNHHPKICP